MPQTDPFTYNTPKKMSDTELARALRLDAAAELDAMSLYEAHIDATDNEDARKVLAFIAKDEKEHFALFTELIRRLDPDQAEEHTAASAKLYAILAAAVGQVDEDTVDAAVGDQPLGEVAEERDRLRRPTVGSLLGRVQD
jgi:rubrerythrin